MITALLLILAIGVVSMLIPQLLSRSIIGPVFRLFVIPGVIVHELAHAAMCVVTGAKIHRIRLFKRDGGDVAHERSPIPLVGALLITMAPLLIGLVLILLIARLMIPNIDQITVGATIHDFPAFMFAVVHQVHWASLKNWFLLYLILSIGATVAPSPRDLMNSWLPILIILILIGVVIKTGFYHAQFDHFGQVIAPGLVLALFVLLIIAAFSFIIYAVSSIFGISR